MESLKITCLLLAVLICRTDAINIKYLTFVSGSWNMEQDLKDLLKSGTYEGFKYSGVENYKLVNANYAVAEAVFDFESQDEALTPVKMGKVLKAKYPNKYLAQNEAPGRNFKMGVAVPRLYKGTVAAYKDKKRLPYNTDYSKIDEIRNQLTLLLHNKIEHDDVPTEGIHYALVNKIYHQDMFYDSESKHIMDFDMVLYSVGSKPVPKSLIEKNLDVHVALQEVTYGIKLTKWKFVNDFETPDPFCKESYLIKFTAEKTDNTKKLANTLMVLMNKATIGDRNLYTTFTPNSISYGEYYLMRLRSHCGLTNTPGSTYEKYWKRSEKMLIKDTPIKSIISVTKQ